MRNETRVRKTARCASIGAACLFTLGLPGTALADGQAVMDTPSIEVNSKAEPNRDTLSIRGVITAAPGTDPVAEALAPGSGVNVTVFGSDVATVIGDGGWGAAQCKPLASGRAVKCKDSSGRRICISSSAAKPGIYRVNAFVPKVNVYVGPPFDLPLAATVEIPGGQAWLGTTTLDGCKTQRNGERATCKSVP